MEAELGTRFIHPTPALRLFVDPDEAAIYEDRSKTLFPELVSRPHPPADPTTFAAPFGGFQMISAARLDVTTYLDASRRHFARDDGYLAASVNAGQMSSYYRTGFT